MSALAYHKINKQLKEDIWKCNLSKHDIKDVIKDTNSFWASVLAAWCEYNYVDEIPDEEVGNQIIWFNSKIKIGNATFLWKKPYQKGLMHLHQLIVEKEFMSYEMAEETYGLDFMRYNSLKSAVTHSLETRIN